MTEQNYKIVPHDEIGFLPKLYVWSVIFESFVFFTLADQVNSGFTMTIGKILQLLVMAWLILGRLLSGRNIYIVNPRIPAYRYFAIFLGLAIVSAIIGLLSGAYTLRYEYSSDNAANFISGLIRGATTRPFLEYAIFIYYFIYFAVLPRYLLNSDSKIAYFFRWFGITFIICVVVGFADLAIQSFGIPGIPRNLYDWRDVGPRFHSFAGEPRDAFVYLALGLGALNLREYWLKRQSIGMWWIVIISIAALLAQSASGLIGLIFGALLLLWQGMSRLSLRNIISLLVMVIAITSVVVISYQSTRRLQVYGQAIDGLYAALESGKPVPPVLRGQMNNIYPVWKLYKEASAGNIFPLLIGSGMGSASVANNNLGSSIYSGLTNPHSQIIRLIYECGIIGTALLILAFTYPIRRFAALMEPHLRRRFTVIGYLLVGFFLGHRTTAPFIYLGIILIVMDSLLATSKSSLSQSLATGEQGS